MLIFVIYARIYYSHWTSLSAAGVYSSVTGQAIVLVQTLRV